MASLRVEQARKAFGSVEILKGIDLAIDSGEFLVLVGPSGCGKSTLLNLIAGLETITSGQILIDDKVVNDISPKDRDIAMVFQSYALYPNMNVRKNLSFGLETRKVPKQEIAEIIEKVAAMLQIENLLDRKPSQLSGGQRQRVAMGRALARNPKVFLFDEPLSNLDAKLRVEMRTEIKLLHQRIKTTIVYVTHDQIEAMTLADRIAIMKDGELQQFDTPREVYRNPANQFVAGFIGSPAMNFIPTAIARHNDAPVVVLDTGAGEKQLVPLPQTSTDFGAYLDQRVILGIRPEQITDTAQPSVENQWLSPVPCGVKLSEPTGPDTHVVVTINDTEVTCRLHPDIAARPGETVELLMDMEKALFFDPDTGLRLR
ncbi:MAG: sn-glycerol-3-phosphate ABC transporter ATP-binding protein UgpC [Desulfofustis sp. PB-SRB1]|jgi:multiple sugar transport system ATP-binding protein|nr:sn-glycerol-3-phosphate ABC transporter ATP-binding protein UgpC [Desulfofustis sp. PB-SRB1]MBM1003719.1 sn-glycerol-3-phosphate ABC transporter ATP-binding protein UgpC [Desulfofustis sp. PB-SRB1]HBH29986.1 sugar ABC transporter ATP-binding protein [Desulfofustis sp.]HBH31214.1 sugar ABC transporter ATP-binding protein [Desulfofustis sp.]